MKRIILTIIAALFFVSPTRAVDVHTADFINNQSRTNFNSFENLPAPGVPPINAQGLWILNDPFEAIYEEDGIVVTQIFFEVAPGAEWSGIWTTHFPSHGIRDWYPNGGDDGYTRITRSNGSDFSNIGFTLSSGVGANKYLYILLNDGLIVDQGWVVKPGGHGYLGFSGGGFDMVLVRSIQTNSTSPNFFDMSPNGLGIDEIELSDDFKVLPEGRKMLDGFIDAGQMSNLFASDDSYLELDPSPTKNLHKQKIHLIVQATSTSASPTNFGFRLESNMLGGPSGDVTQTVALWNFDSGQFEVLDTRPAAAISDEIVEVAATGDLSRFIQAGTNEITAGLTWTSGSFSGSPFHWWIDVDEAVWLID